MFGFYTALVEFYTEEVLRGFLLCGFPEENLCVPAFLCFCAYCSFSDLLVDNCFKISSKQFKENSAILSLVEVEYLRFKLLDVLMYL